MTRNEYIDDIEMRMYGGNPSDDSVVRSQIGAVLDSVAMTVMSEWVRKANGGYIPASVITHYNAVVKKRDDGCGKPVYYVELPQDIDGYTLKILPLVNDIGLVEVEIGTQRVLATGSIALLKNTLDLQFGRKTALYLWTGTEVQLYNGVFIEGSTIKLWGVFIDTDPASTRPYPVVGDVQAQVLNTASEILMKELQTKQDLVDDGI